MRISMMSINTPKHEWMQPQVNILLNDKPISVVGNTPQYRYAELFGEAYLYDMHETKYSTTKFYADALVTELFVMACIVCSIFNEHEYLEVNAGFSLFEIPASMNY